jgi:hypothetical protein
LLKLLATGRGDRTDTGPAVRHPDEREAIEETGLAHRAQGEPRSQEVDVAMGATVDLQCAAVTILLAQEGVAFLTSMLAAVGPLPRFAKVPTRGRAA